MVLTLGNLLVDILMHIEGFPVEAGALQGVSRIVIGPGGACNVAIMASRFGLSGSSGKIAGSIRVNRSPFRSDSSSLANCASICFAFTS